jgi:large subunit ribosomal protein L25
VLYGKDAARAIAIEERALRTALSGPSGLHAIIDVVLDDQKSTHHAVLAEYQRHPVRGVVTHVDFHEVRLDQTIHATVSVQLVGESPGVKLGGVLQQVARELNVESLPGAIPEHIEVDLGDLDIGGAIRLEDIPSVEGVTFLDDPHETVLASCTAPKGLAELEEAEGEEGEGEPGAEGQPEESGGAEADAES